MPLDVLETLCDLVRLPSVNPMGRDVSGDEYFEYQVTDYLERLFARLGLAWQRQHIEPRRDNIVARLDGDPLPQDGGAVLMFEAHQDTVPVDGMTIPPWTPTLCEGRIYGRGACDIKGGMACMLAALSRLAEERPAGRPTIVMACSVNEEYGFGGAPRIPELWEDGSGFVPRAPDGVIVAEPTSLDVVVAHKGALRWRCHARGRAAHSSQPQFGDNAIYRMARVLQTLEGYARDVVPTLGQHPLVGLPTLSVGLISGGVSVNTVPDFCSIEIDRRVLPEEDPHEALAHVTSFVARALAHDPLVEHETPYLISSGLSDELSRDFAARLSRTICRHGGAGRCVGVPYGTDAPAFSSRGIPTVVFGPGSIQQAHTADEWVAIDQLQTATEILYEFARGASP
ncbi:MAG: M20 family metallopeptidase [Candidatus Anammoximicrobium sp.]|nr:M20 family metallopeptidase [Candidatus Anammoximicrobium sp.]